MGTEYTFVCEDCKKYYGIGKDSNALYLMPTLLREHEGHNVLVYSEHETDMEANYEGSNYPHKNIDTGYTEVDVFGENGLISRLKNFTAEWDYGDFYDWYSNQKWHIDAYPPRKKHTSEELAERQERTAKSVQKFYETLDDDIEDYLNTDDTGKWYLPDSEKDKILSYDPKDWVPVVGHADKYTDNN